MAKCRLSERNEQRLSALIGIPYQAIYSRGGWGTMLEAWRDEHNADEILRDRQKRPVSVYPKIRDGKFVSTDVSVVWAAKQTVALTVDDLEAGA